MSNHAHRDIKCASDVASMVALGKFEKEFIAYGTATKANDGQAQSGKCSGNTLRGRP